MDARLAEVVGPATYAVAEQYRRYGLRWRVLTLPVMVALLVALIWRQVPSVRGWPGCWRATICSGSRRAG